MTLSINWDAASTSDTTYEYAESYEDLFGMSTHLFASEPLPALTIWPSVVRPGDNVHATGISGLLAIELIDMKGKAILVTTSTDGIIPIPADIAAGLYTIRIHLPTGSPVSWRVAIVVP